MFEWLLLSFIVSRTPSKVDLISKKENRINPLQSVQVWVLFISFHFVNLTMYCPIQQYASGLWLIFLVHLCSSPIFSFSLVFFSYLISSFCHLFISRAVSVRSSVRPSVCLISCLSSFHFANFKNYSYFVFRVIAKDNCVGVYV